MNAASLSPSEDKYLTREQVCELLGINKRTLYEWQRVGKAPPRLKVGRTLRFPKSALDKFIAGNIEG